MACAEENKLGDGDFMTEQMLDDFEPSDELKAKFEEKAEDVEGLMKGLADVEDEVRDMLKRANEQSTEDLEKVLDEFMGYCK